MKNSKTNVNKSKDGFFKKIPDDILESSIPTMQTHYDRPNCQKEDIEEVATRKNKR